MLNDWAVPKMSEMGTQCAGHEGAGVIVKIGSQVKELKVGMRAGFKPIADTCGSCEHCRQGNETYCAKAVLTGLHCDGEYTRIPWSSTSDLPCRFVQAVHRLPRTIYNSHPRRSFRLCRGSHHVLG
jgi:D-arabinose 1-dehydrogenase-like Zn-dependent alcohol dehydrogenase